MMIPTRSLTALALALFGPFLYLTHDKVSFLLPEQVAPLHPPIHRLQTYLRIRTDHPHPQYEEAVHFLKETTTTLLPNASFTVHRLFKHLPIIIVTVEGTNPHLPSVLLNSHTDVVPAEESKWLNPPFAARLLVSNGQLRMYARGSQDMKSVGLQYLEALNALLSTGWKPVRTIHVSFVPEEEVGSAGGMRLFVTTDAFDKLNVGVAMDEGLPNPDTKFSVYYGERQTWWLKIKVDGKPGHGYTMPSETASSILHTILGNALKYRDMQLQLLKNGTDIGNVVGINISYLKSGLPKGDGHVMNIIPSTAEAGLDIRLPPFVPRKAVEDIIKGWFTCESGPCPGAYYEYITQDDQPFVTSQNPKINPFIEPFLDGMEEAGIRDRLSHEIFPAATDARFVRGRGIPCYGFSPIEKTPNLLHKHNEYITIDGYLNGIRIYQSVIRHMADFVMTNLTENVRNKVEEADSFDAVEKAIARVEERMVKLEKEDL